MYVGPALIVCFLMVSMTAVKSQILKGPKNALKKVGDSVTLECVTSSNNCHQVDWAKVEGLQSPKLVYRQSTGMLNNDIYPTTRYSVNSNGGCSLTITQLEINDSGRFICMHAVDSGEERRTAILVVISVKESCLSNVTSNALDKDDGYSLRCAINIPAKSVEPSNVTLSFHDKIVGEKETTDENQPLTVKTTLTGTARKENITRGCRASFSPNTVANYDNTVSFLDVCTKQWIVSYPVENIAASLLSGKDDTVRCTADGHPPPTFKWTHGKSGAEVDGDTLVIKGDAGDKYTCIATNTFKGTTVSRSVLYEAVVTPPPRLLSAPGYGSGSVAGAVIGTIICCVVIAIGGVLFVSWKNEWSPLYVFLHSRKNKKKGADYPVANILISVSPLGPDKGYLVRCTADGHPPPTFKWTIGKSGAVVDGDTLVIKGDAGDKYTCTATNTVNGKETSQNTTIEFTSPPPGGADYPVENIFISVSPPGPDTSDGHPPPTFKWTHSKSGAVADGDTLVITGDTGGNYTCTATNTVNGKETSQNITVEFTSPPPEALGPGGIVTGTIIGSGVIRGVSFVVWRRSEKEDDKDGERANDPSTDVSIGEPKMTSTNFILGEPEKGPAEPPSEKQ